MGRKALNSAKPNDQALAKIARTKVEKQCEWKVEDREGLSLVVTPGGAATFYLRYHVGTKPNIKWRRVALGRYAPGGHGGMSLADATTKARELTSQIERGTDVVAVAAERATALTLRQLFEQRFERDTDTARRTLEDYKAALERDVFPTLGDALANEITAEQFAVALEGVAVRAKHAAHKARVALGSTYRWGMRQWSNGRRVVTQNPTATIGFTFQSERRKRVLTDTELGKLWKAIATRELAGTIGGGTADIVRLAILTGQRNSEVAGMQAAELKGLDTATPRWDIPAQRMKRKSDDQHVPLSRQSVEIIKGAVARPSDGVHVFTGTTHGRKDGQWRQMHIGQETVSRAFSQIAATAGLDNVVLHDMRKCVTTWLAEHGHATPDVLDAILHHGRKGVTGTHYNFALYEGQVRKALQIWADHVDAVAAGSAAADGCGNVVQLHGAA